MRVFYEFYHLLKKKQYRDTEVSGLGKFSNTNLVIIDFDTTFLASQKRKSFKNNITKLSEIRWAELSSFEL